jgi:putative membrane protein
VIASISGLPAFLLYVVVAFGLIALYLVIYTLATAHNEFALIRQNCVAAAAALSFSLVGFALPLASAIVNSANIIDCLIWGMIALVVQIGIYFLTRLFVPDLSTRIEQGEISPALLLGTFSLAAGMITAASMTY